MKEEAPQRPVFIIKPALVESLEEIESSQGTIVTEDTSKKSKMMAKVLGFKNNLKMTRNDEEKA